MSTNRRQLSSPIKVRVTFNDELVHEQVFHDYPIVIGRNSSCDIPLVDFDYVSRQHVVIREEDDGKLYYVDLESSNAFLFQGIVTKKIAIQRITSITIGPIEITTSREEAYITPPEATQSPLDDEKTKAIFIDPNDQNRYIDEIDAKTSGEADYATDPATEIAAAPPPASPSIPPSSPPVDVDNKLVMQDTERSANLFRQHPHASTLNVENRVLEAYVQWNDQIYDHQNFYPNSKISLGSTPRANLKNPQVRGHKTIAYYDDKSSYCLIPNGKEAVLNRAGKKLSIEDLISAGLVARKPRGYLLQLQNEDVLNLQYNDNSNIIMRYAPAPKRLSKMPMLNPDEEIRKSFTISFLIHFFIIVLALIAPPPTAPKIKNVPKRYAKLLVQPPKKIINLPKKKKKKPKPTPAPKKKKVEKKKPKKKKRIVQKKPIKKQVIKKNKAVQKVNRRKPVKKPKPKIQELGALAALGNMKPNPKQQQVAVNINPNAGGARKSLNTKGLVSNLKTKSGKLASSGSPGVNTKGLGVGSGKGFGTQGLQGRAGKRGVGGAVVGSPSLAKSGKKEGLSRKQVMDTLKKYLSKIQRCYERSLFDNPDLKGRVEYQWEISPKGKVQWAKVVKSDISGADSLNSCVKGVFLSMKFPRAKNGQSTVPKIGFPFGRL